MYFDEWVSKLDAVIIGPGLSRDHYLQSMALDAVEILKKHSLPVIFDGDGLRLIENNPSLSKGLKCVLTPNHNEYRRLLEAVANN